MVKSFSTAFLVSFIFYFFDWLFQRTGNLPLSALSPRQAYLSLSMGLLVFTFAFFMFYAGVDLLSRLLGRFLNEKIQSIAHGIKIVPTAAIFALVLGLLVNNFTNTMLGVGVALADSPITKTLCIALFLSFAGYFAFELRNISRSKLFKSKKIHATIATCGTIAMLPSIIFTIEEKLNPSEASFNYSTSIAPENLPNILFLQGDGIDAEKLSVYGFEKQTTPFLDSIRDKMNIWTNFYPSNCCTYGTHYALLTGIHPTSTNVYYPPAQVPENQSLFSLPQVLKKIGYVTYQDTVPYYADASFMGLPSAFTYGNETLEGAHPVKRMLLKILPSRSFNLLRPARRSTVRYANLLKTLFTDTFKDGLALVETSQAAEDHPDDPKVARVLKFIESQKDPWFLQVHLMGTHGAKFSPRSPFFSKGKLPQISWQEDFYLDAIRDWDSDVEKIISSLSQAQNNRETLIIVTSDHGMAWNSASRIPLLTLTVKQTELKPMFKINAKLNLNALHESIDVPITISNLLGITPTTPWMQGVPLNSSDQKQAVVSANALYSRIDDVGEFALVTNTAGEFSGVRRFSVQLPENRTFLHTLDPVLQMFTSTLPQAKRNEILPPLRPSQQLVHEIYGDNRPRMKNEDTFALQ